MRRRALPTTLRATPCLSSAGDTAQQVFDVSGGVYLGLSVGVDAAMVGVMGAAADGVGADSIR